MNDHENDRENESGHDARDECANVHVAWCYDGGARENGHDDEFIHDARVNEYDGDHDYAREDGDEFDLEKCPCISLR